MCKKLKKIEKKPKKVTNYMKYYSFLINFGDFLVKYISNL